MANILNVGVDILHKTEPDGPAFVQSFIRASFGKGKDLDALRRSNSPKDTMQLNLVTNRAFAIWMHTPLPSQQYQRGTIIPQPNESCWCGSGSLFRQCCSRNLENDMFPEELPVRTLLECIAETELPTIWKYLPKLLLANIAFGWVDDAALVERGRLMLEPILAQDDASLDQSDEIVLECLISIYTALDQAENARLLTQRFSSHPNNVLQTAAQKHHCHYLAEQGSHDEARAMIETLLQRNPTDLGLCYVELIILNMGPDMQRLCQRAKYWLDRLKKSNSQGELDGMIEYIQAVWLAGDSDLNEAKEPFDGKHDVEEVEGFTRWLSEWLDQLEKDPVESMHECSIYEGENIISLRENADFCSLETSWRNLNPTGSNVDFDALKDLLEGFPELAGNFNVLNDLTEVYDGLKRLAPFGDRTEPLLPVINQAHHQLNDTILVLLHNLFPQKIEHPLCMTQNSNIGKLIMLRLRKIAHQLCTEKRDDKTLDLMTWMMALDPTDQVEIRGDLAVELISREKDSEVVSHCERFSDDQSAKLLYAHSLAILRLGDRTHAEKLMNIALHHDHKIGKMLLKLGENPSYDFKTSDDELAWLDRTDLRAVWLKSNGIMLLKTCLDQRAQQSAASRKNKGWRHGGAKKRRGKRR